MSSSRYTPRLRCYHCPSAVRRRCSIPQLRHRNPSIFASATRLARNPWDGSALIGSPHPVSDTRFKLVVADTIDLGGGEGTLVKSHDGGTDYEWQLVAIAVDPELSEPGPVLRSFPNPILSSARINFSLPQRSEVRLEIFDLRGARVRTLHRGELSAGPHGFDWDPRSSDPGLSPGVYFVRLRTLGQEVSEKIVFLP